VVRFGVLVIWLLRGDAHLDITLAHDRLDVQPSCIGGVQDVIKGADIKLSERSVRTVLFTDLVGHTEMMSRLGDAKGRDVLREHERITHETLKQHGGAEVKTMGDGFMASFGSVTMAVECGVALQRAFAERDGEPLNVRVGLNAGEPIEEDGDLFGATVILASRIAAKAGAGRYWLPTQCAASAPARASCSPTVASYWPRGSKSRCACMR
jgi:class 3 adenylate cyclase